MGFEVFMNAGGSGPIDIVAIDTEGNTRLFDVKTHSILYDTGRYLSEEQKRVGVEMIWFEPETRLLSFCQKDLRKKIKEKRKYEQET